MSGSVTASRHLRSLLAAEDIVVAPGAWDGITARLIEQAGFPAVYMTGAGTSLARGYPDYGLITFSEMVENAGIIARSITIPLISDADTGYGNELNVTRTVREFERRGVAAIHIEDQVLPKRCGHLDGKEVVSREEFVAKIRAAVAARRDPDFIIIARTDSRAVIGFDEAVDRAKLARQAGADVAFVEAVQSFEEMAAVPKLVGGPCLLNLVAGGKTPLAPLPEIQAMGYRLAILPGALLLEVIPAIDGALQTIMATEAHAVACPGVTIAGIYDRFGAREWDALREAANAIVEA